MVNRKQKLILRTITLRKILNFFLVTVSFYFSKWIHKPIVFGKPYTLNLEPTNYCNLQCPECPTGMGILTREKGNQSFEDFKLYIDSVKKDLIFLVLYFQGEPFINKQLLDMVRYAYDNKIFVQISTNGHFIPDEKFGVEILNSGLGELIMSMDGMTQETYLQYRVNGNFQKAKSTFELLCQLKEKLKLKNAPWLSLQFLVSKLNEHEIDSIKSFGHQIGADQVLLKSMQVYNFDGIEDILPENKKYRRYKKNNSDEWELIRDGKNSCYKLWSNTLVSWDGKVAPCCFDKDLDFTMGNLKTEKFTDVWNNEKYDSFRTTLLKSRKEIEMCKNCTEGLSAFRD